MSSLLPLTNAEQYLADMKQKISSVMVAGALGRVVNVDGICAFALAGKCASSLGTGSRPGAIDDGDLMMRGDLAQLGECLDCGLQEPYRGFTFRRGPIRDSPTRPLVKQTRVRVSFSGRVLSTLLLEVTPLDPSHDEELASRFPGLSGVVALSRLDVDFVMCDRYQLVSHFLLYTELLVEGYAHPYQELIDLGVPEAVSVDTDEGWGAMEFLFEPR